MKLQQYQRELSGTNYEIGQTLGRLTAAVPPLATTHTAGMPNFGEAEVKKAIALFSRWCPGLDEELAGFADALGTAPEKIIYYGMTSLRPRPRCTQIAVPASHTATGRPLVARNYEFSSEAEDFTLLKTSAKGRYTHLGTSVLHFGRDDGFNEHGLSVTMSSCGFPVGPMPYMRAPKIEGLQFWAVIRALLENCKTVEESLAYLEGMPIAYNLNMMLVDRSGAVALVETLDGKRAVKQLAEGEGPLCATNHAVLPPLAALEPQAMRHSLIRHQWIGQQLQGKTGITVEDLQAMLLSEFPNGLACRYYNDFFGTTKSMVIDPAAATIHLCWGGLAQNGWRSYNIGEPLPETAREIELQTAPFPKEMAEFVPFEAPAV